MMTWPILIVWFPLFTLLGWYVAYQKGRSPWEGFIFGILLGPFGLLIVACLPIGDLPRPGPMAAHRELGREPGAPEPSPALTDKQREAIQREMDREPTAPEPQAVWLPNKRSRR
ncbi:MAG: hypothetical protein ACLQVF_15660 [Isosphaeraceae bacterium]